jgi:hypothetical protein
MLRILDAVQWQADHFAEGGAGRRRLPARLLPSERGDTSDKTFPVALREQGGYSSYQPGRYLYAIAALAASPSGSTATCRNLRRRASPERLRR